MTKLTSTLIAAAATGILGALGGCAHDEPPPAQTPAASTPTMPSGGTSAVSAKHACKGQNDCKGQGGCKTDKHACKAQNDCKGQGGCKST
jgi:hypothetical protein